MCCKEILLVYYKDYCSTMYYFIKEFILILCLIGKYFCRGIVPFFTEIKKKKNKKNK